MNRRRLFTCSFLLNSAPSYTDDISFFEVLRKTREIVLFYINCIQLDMLSHSKVKNTNALGRTYINKPISIFVKLCKILLKLKLDFIVPPLLLDANDSWERYNLRMQTKLTSFAPLSYVPNGWKRERKSMAMSYG